MPKRKPQPARKGARKARSWVRFAYCYAQPGGVPGSTLNLFSQHTTTKDAREDVMSYESLYRVTITEVAPRRPT